MPPTTRSHSAHEHEAVTYSTAVDNLSSDATHPPVQADPASSFLTNDTAYVASQRTASYRKNKPVPPPIFAIDLSLPPELRYLEVCAAFKHEMRNLTSLFDEVVGSIVRVIPSRLLRFICALLLRKVYNDEENAELKGISKATGVEMYLLVCFNVLLDLFMGCSSGGARVRDEDSQGDADGQGTKMLHFRTLDWGMPALRRVVVQLDYKLGPDEPVIARSITYAGFVGVLTGVREGLSMSLNFRPTHDYRDRFNANFRYYGNHLMILLGLRPSISSTLRSFLLPRRIVEASAFVPSARRKHHLAYADYEDDIIARFGRRGPHAFTRPITTTACYLCFSNGAKTTVIEKDRVNARLRSSEDFIVVTNADFIGTDDAPTSPTTMEHTKDNESSSFAAALAEIAHEANDRKQCAEHNWRRMQRAKAHAEAESENVDDSALARLMNVDDVVELVQKFPTTNEVTHFACVMDPKRGEVKWCRVWERPIGARWIREHMSEGW